MVQLARQAILPLQFSSSSTKVSERAHRRIWFRDRCEDRPCPALSHSVDTILALRHLASELKRFIAAGISARMIEQLVLAVAWNRIVVILAICFGSVATLMMPVSIALLSKNTASFEQVKFLSAEFPKATHSARVELHSSSCRSRTDCL